MNLSLYLPITVTFIRNCIYMGLNMLQHQWPFRLWLRWTIYNTRWTPKKPQWLTVLLLRRWKQRSYHQR